MDYTTHNDYLSALTSLLEIGQQNNQVTLTFINNIPLDNGVNQCQGFCYNSKKDVFVLACINSDNTKQIIYELDPNTFSIVSKHEYNEPKLLAHMNTLTYNPDTNRLYTTNAVVNGYIVTPIEADSFIVEKPISVKEKVFNLAFDPTLKRFASIVPIDDSMRRINYYSPDFKLIKSTLIDAKHHDLNNNGAYADNGMVMFTTLSTVVTVNSDYTLQSIMNYPKKIEIEDIDRRNGTYYVAVNTKPGVAIYSMTHE